MASNTIQLDGDGFIAEEAVGSGTILPGMLLEKTSAGLVQAHSDEGGRSQKMVAVEDALQGKTVDDSYSTGALIQYHIERPGTRFQGLLTAGETVVKGQALISAGDGKLIAATSIASGEDLDEVTAYAEEAVDLSGSDAVDTLIAVRAA